MKFKSDAYFRFILDIFLKYLNIIMIEKKSLVMAIKRALESGGFNYVGQEATQIPPQLWNIDDLQIEDQNWWECNPILKVDVSNN